MLELSQVRISWFIVFIVLGVLACSLLDRIEILSRRQNATRPQCIINIPPELRREAG
ncbi:MAG: hypothetical protein ACO2PN_10575 [Pyrobaculum sp.]